MAVSDFSLHEGLLGLITHVGCWTAASGMLTQVGPMHLHLQPDPWVILICLHFERGEMELGSEKIEEWKSAWELKVRHRLEGKCFYNRTVLDYKHVNCWEFTSGHCKCDFFSPK